MAKILTGYFILILLLVMPSFVRICIDFFIETRFTTGFVREFINVNEYSVLSSRIIVAYKQYRKIWNGHAPKQRQVFLNGKCG